MKQQGGQPVSGEWAKQQQKGVEKQQSGSNHGHDEKAVPMDEPLKKHGDPLLEDTESGKKHR